MIYNLQLDWTWIPNTAPQPATHNFALAYTVDAGTPSADFSFTIDPDTGLITINYTDDDNGCSGSYTVTLTSTDPDLSKVETYTWTISPTPPKYIRSKEYSITDGVNKLNYHKDTATIDHNFFSDIFNDMDMNEIFDTNIDISEVNSLTVTYQKGNSHYILGNTPTGIQIDFSAAVSTSDNDMELVSATITLKSGQIVQFEDMPATIIVHSL